MSILQVSPNWIGAFEFPVIIVNSCLLLILNSKLVTINKKEVVAFYQSHDILRWRRHECRYPNWKIPFSFAAIQVWCLQFSRTFVFSKSRDLTTIRPSIFFKLEPNWCPNLVTRALAERGQLSHFLKVKWP